MVDGVAASIHTDGPLGLSEDFEQGFFAPFRAAWHLAPGLMRWLHRTRAVPRLLIGLEDLTVKVRELRSVLGVALTLSSQHLQ